MSVHSVFITGGTGYLGSRLIPRLKARGHAVRALVRPGSEGKLPSDAEPVAGNALDVASFSHRVAPADTFVQLLGVPHPSPAKAEQFRAIDLVSIRASVTAAEAAGVRHFVYVSVAQPAPIMKAYQEVRAEGERLLQAAQISTTVLRPWYVLGPGHWWPYALVPVYWICERLAATRAGAQRCGLVTLEQMLRALIQAVENPPENFRIVPVPGIREAAVGSSRPVESHRASPCPKHPVPPV